MSDETQGTQDTQPAKGEPVKIPVPMKADVLDAFRKVATAEHSDDESR